MPAIVFPRPGSGFPHSSPSCSGLLRGPYWNKAITEIPSSPYQPGVNPPEVEVDFVPGPFCVSMRFCKASPSADKSAVLSLVWEDGTVQHLPISM